MDWGDVKSAIGSAAPLLGSALGGPAGGAIGGMIASALGVEQKPDSILEAIKTNPDAIVELQRIEHEHQRELRSMLLQAETQQLAQINETMRAELRADDKYKSYWRPTFGYSAAVTWTLQCAGLIYAIIASPVDAAEIIVAVSALTPMWGVALAVLGINITKRSHDKQIAAGQQPSGLLQGLAKRVGGGA